MEIWNMDYHTRRLWSPCIMRSNHIVSVYSCFIYISLCQMFLKLILKHADLQLDSLFLSNHLTVNWRISMVISCSSFGIYVPVVASKTCPKSASATCLRWGFSEVADINQTIPKCRVTVICAYTFENGQNNDGSQRKILTTF